MNTTKTPLIITFLVTVMLWLFTSASGLRAQTPQDNWYQDPAWTNNYSGLPATSGGLLSPYGVALGPDGRIYVGDQGYGCIQVYLTNGTYSFMITNGFGGGLKFGQPRGMITDTSSNLYVADYSSNCVYEFTGSGTYIRKFGSGTGSGNGQLSGVIDVAVSSSGLVYVLENGNSRLSVFNPDGTFNSILIGSGTLDGQLSSPVSIAISDAGKLFVSQNNFSNVAYFFNSNPTFGSQMTNHVVKAFDTNGVYSFKFSPATSVYLGADSANYYYGELGPTCLRCDRTGLLHVMLHPSAWFNYGCCAGLPSFTTNAYNSLEKVYTSEGSLISTITLFSNLNALSFVSGPVSQYGAVGPDGTILGAGTYSDKNLHVYRYAMREQYAQPRNPATMPQLLGASQRTNSGFVDIDYKVTDVNDTTVTTAMLAFTNGVQSISNCVRVMTLAENTGTNLGAGVTANQIHHITWNAAADWSTSLGNFRVAILAKDSRTNLLDVHYLQLPADRGFPTVKISSSPLIQSDFSQAWWWLLATNDPGITITGTNIVGVGGSYNNQVLCAGDNNTTANGRSYIYAKMNVREATPAEVSWASQGSQAGITNKFTPVVQVSGRPKAVNEYGFDTGAWGTNAWWIVAQF